MNFFKRLTLIVILIILFLSCKTTSKNTITQLKSDIIGQIEAIDGQIAVAFIELNNKKKSIMINAEESFHAASTMKIPVMIELFKQQKEGLINLNDSIVVANEFKSIVDGSTYTLNIKDDSDDITYGKIGSKQTLYDLITPMITLSSNLATNILIDIVSPEKTTSTMHKLGANNFKILRGVEDQKAYDLGLSNSTTAHDLSVIMTAIADGSAGTKNDCEAMISLLKNQEWNDMIPKYLPRDIQVAHKTGAIAGVHHDTAIIYLPNGNKYILVLLSKNLKDFEQATDQLAVISKTIYNFMIIKNH